MVDGNSLVRVDHTSSNFTSIFSFKSNAHVHNNFCDYDICIINYNIAIEDGMLKKKSIRLLETLRIGLANVRSFLKNYLSFCTLAIGFWMLWAPPRHQVFTTGYLILVSSLKP